MIKVDAKKGICTVEGTPANITAEILGACYGLIESCAKAKPKLAAMALADILSGLAKVVVKAEKEVGCDINGLYTKIFSGEEDEDDEDEVDDDADEDEEDEVNEKIEQLVDLLDDLPSEVKAKIVKTIRKREDD